jgi:DNA topoisomerase VI subunit A
MEQQAALIRIALEEYIPHSHFSAKEHIFKQLKRVIYAESLEQDYMLLISKKPVKNHRQHRFVAIIKRIYELLLSNKVQTIREFYYQNFDIFTSQGQSNRILESLQIGLKVRRSDLNVIATPKAIIRGPIQFNLKSATLNCMPIETQIPTINQILSIETSAREVIVVEKYSTFQQLIEFGFFEKFKDKILVTAKGFPDLSTRVFLNKLMQIEDRVVCYEQNVFDSADFDFRNEFYGSETEELMQDSKEVNKLEFDINEFWDSDDGLVVDKEDAIPDRFWESDLESENGLDTEAINNGCFGSAFWKSDDESDRLKNNIKEFWNSDGESKTENNISTFWNSDSDIFILQSSNSTKHPSPAEEIQNRFRKLADPGFWISDDESSNSYLQIKKDSTHNESISVDHSFWDSDDDSHTKINHSQRSNPLSNALIEPVSADHETRNDRTSSQNNIPESRNQIKGKILVDCDPHGIQIMICYTQGTKRLEYLSSTLTAPLLFLGY